jgi:hypothetical protein
MDSGVIREKDSEIGRDKAKSVRSFIADPWGGLRGD